MTVVRTAVMSLAVSLLVAAGRAPVAVADETQLYTALKHEALFAALNIRLQRAWGVGYPGAGLEYTVDSSALAVRLAGIRLGVHPSREAAQDAARRYLRSCERGPTTAASAQFGEVGDLRYAWETGGGGHLFFIRENVTVAFSWGGAKEDGLALARQIDQLIQTDRAIAPRGTFAQTPEIISTAVPSTMAKHSSAEIHPEVRGLGDPQKTMVKVIDCGQNDTLAKGKTDQTLALHAPADVYAPGAVRLLMVAANEDNVFVAKEFTIDLTD